jgi:hypothetical protein
MQDEAVIDFRVPKITVEIHVVLSHRTATSPI